MTAKPPFPIATGQLALSFLLASDALNDELLKRLEVAGWPPITKNQSLVFAYLSTEGTTASELARQVGITRQSMQKLLEYLQSNKLIRMKSHPKDSRSLLVTLSAQGRRLMTAAQKHLEDIEAEVEIYIGASAIKQLRQAVSHDWKAMFPR